MVTVSLKMLFHSILLRVQLSQAKSAAENKLSEVESNVRHRDEQISQLQATVDDLHKVRISNVHRIKQ
jgi:peptidoglycan hydrolase CwlO-like protein